MVFNNIGKDVEYFQYSADSKKVDCHLKINKSELEDLNKVIAVYKEYGFDTTNKSEMISMLIKNYVADLSDDETSILNIMSQMKTFRECL